VLRPGCERTKGRGEGEFREGEGERQRDGASARASILDNELELYEVGDTFLFPAPTHEFLLPERRKERKERRGREGQSGREIARDRVLARERAQVRGDISE